MALERTTFTNIKLQPKNWAFFEFEIIYDQLRDGFYLDITIYSLA